MASSKVTTKTAGGESRRSGVKSSVKTGKPRRPVKSRGVEIVRMAAQATEPSLALRASQAELPEWLVRSAVYRRVPLAERTKLDQAIIFRPVGLATIEAIVKHFKLAEKFDVSAAEVAVYAEKVEQLVRPEVTSHVLAGVLGCLPKSYRRQIVAGSEVLLVSRLLRAINTHDTILTVAEMAKLASIMLSLSRRSGPVGGVRGSQTKGKSQAEGEPSANGQDPIKLAESVRLLYGLEWDRNTEHGPNSGAQAVVNQMETRVAGG